MSKGTVAIAIAGIFIVGVIVILFLNQGCANLEIDVPFFGGKFEHCARGAVAGDATERALMNMGLSEDVASTASKAIEKAVVDSLDRGESAPEAAQAAVAAALNARPPLESAARTVAVIAGATAAAAVASDSVDEASQAANAAAQAAASGENERAAEEAALNDGASENVANVAGTALEIGVSAAQEADDSDLEATQPEESDSEVPREVQNSTVADDSDLEATQPEESDSSFSKGIFNKNEMANALG